MPITINCTHCHRQLQLQEAHLGKQVRCPACQQIFTASEPPPAEVEEAVPDVSAFEVPEAPAAPITPKRRPRRRADEDSLDFEAETRRRMERPEDDDELDDVRPHRGSVILAMGILTIIFAPCCPLVAWIIGGIGENMAGKDLRMMALRQMDRSGRGITQTGKTLMGIGIALSIISIIVGLVIRFVMRR